MEKTKITVLVNKNFEMDGVAAALVNSGIKASTLPFPKSYHIPPYIEKTPKKISPRFVFEFSDNGKAVDAEVSVWCIQDIMFYDVSDDKKGSSSSSEEKYRVLKHLFDNEWKTDIVISVSTGGYPKDCNFNGCVVLGGNFFLHDGHPGNPASNLKHDLIGKFIPNNVNDKVFSLINDNFKNKVEPKFLKMPRVPCDQPCCMASKIFTAISSVNITDYAEYNWVDPQALAAYEALKVPDEIPNRYPCSSSETTHGVVRMATDKPVIFLSPITDRFGYFDFDVNPAQNFASSFNGGVVLGELLCELRNYAKGGGKFQSKYPPAKPGALTDEPLKGAYKSVGRLKTTAYIPSRI